jgi:hypothetical protein
LFEALAMGLDLVSRVALLTGSSVGSYAHSTCSISDKDDRLFPRTRLIRTGLSARDSATVHSIWTMAPSKAEFERVTVSPAFGEVTLKSF